MQVYVGFDDTDTLEADRGTGKLARWFADVLPPDCTVWGVVRQQLLVHAAIPYTSHNSSACIVVEMPEEDHLAALIDRAAAHIERHFLAGSDPGLCVVRHDHPHLPQLIAFGQRCTREVVSQGDALQAAAGVHLSGHGGTNDGIIGATAAVGLTAYGWSGRFIEYQGLRDIPEQVPVGVLVERGILPVPVGAGAPVPGPQDCVFSGGWLRPRLWGGQAVLPVIQHSAHTWVCADKKLKAKGKEHEDGRQNLLPGTFEGR